MKAEKFLTALLLATGTAVYATFTDGGDGAVTPIELSGFAAGLLKAALAVGLFWAFDRYVLDEIDTVAELKAGNVAYALALLALAVLLAATVATAQPAVTLPTATETDGEAACRCVCSCTPPAGGRAERGPSEVVRARPAHLDTALAYLGTVERGRNNRGPRVERFLGSVGLGPGNPWCAAYVSYVLDVAGVRAPLDGRRRVIRSGLAARFITARSIRASEALRGTKKVPSGAVVVWRKGNGPYGHAGFAVTWDGASGETVEGNTSSGQAGSQRDGDGVWRRERRITPGSYFRIVSFTPVDPAYWR
ncbi:CHAP domain-containing protein [Rubrivirga litoralis]|uniref:CHAP domain-containing protein n=1 Tax=Rubrivirga litoralis TaxID=3075598 RepID=A0ABU3BU98_9BACT|nr:CHAP domain-containing protein [Rubrivirga sp. F394]MDT0632866.1 CHAP domain-containing protein [Rubrivirga sp. F394]